jgi:putative peptide zinc metalloprotease protein
VDASDVDRTSIPADKTDKPFACSSLAVQRLGVSLQSPTTPEAASDDATLVISPSTSARPKLADGVELIGEYEGSGFREPPSLVRRPDGQVIQLPPLLYAVAARADGTRSCEAIAREVSDEMQRGLDAEQVEFVVDEKLRPMGILALADGSSPDVEKPDPFLALKLRTAVIPEHLSDTLGGAFRWLFFPLVVAAVLGAFVAADAWLFFDHGVAQAIRQSILHPGLFLPIFAAVVIAAGFHEIGHAAACRYGGGHPGKMGCGLYLAWPAFYTDVTDAYRLGRRARLRTDLGGIYFNIVLALATVGAYFVTGFEPLLLLVVIQHFEIAHQLLPVVRLDGYYIVADLTGVPDLFARIGPILRSAIPGRGVDDQVRVLKPWVRVAVTAWVFVVVPLLGFELLMVLIHLPRLLGTASSSGSKLLHATSRAMAQGSWIGALSSVLQLVVLAIPVIGILLMLTKVVTGSSRWMWSHTEGRPVRRGLAMAVGVLAVLALARAWIRSDNYAPIQPGERGTFQEGAVAVRTLPTGSGPLYSEQRAHARGAGTTTPSTTSTTTPTSTTSTSTTSSSSTSTSTTSTTLERSTSATSTPDATSTSTSTTSSSSTTTTTAP